MQRKNLTNNVMNEMASLQDLIRSGEADDRKFIPGCRIFTPGSRRFTQAGTILLKPKNASAILLENRNYGTFPFPECQESDFTNKSSIFAGPIYLEGETYLLTLAVLVYAADGSYHGYWMQACDPYLIIKYLYILSGLTVRIFSLWFILTERFSTAAGHM